MQEGGTYSVGEEDTESCHELVGSGNDTAKVLGRALGLVEGGEEGETSDTETGAVV